MNFKVTKWIQVGEKEGEFMVKDNDDTPVTFPAVIPELRVINNAMHTTIFKNARFVSRHPDFKDGDFLVHPVVYSFD
jgi:hypothetical protein